MPVEPAFYPGTSIFINKLNIRDAKELSRAEADFTAVRTEEYLRRPIDGCFDLLHLQGIHFRLFQDIYDWSGEIRGYDMSKEGSIFTPEEKIVEQSDDLFDELENEGHLVGLQRDQFIQRGSYYYDWVNRIHPFPEGNGRTQRLFFSHLAMFAGFEIAWDRVHPWQIKESAKQSFLGNSEPMVILFDDVVL